MIDDDADLETLRKFYSQTPEEIEARKQQKWNEDWNALRMPEHLARVADQPPTQAEGRGRPVTSLDAHQRAFLDTVASHEAPDYDVLYSPDARTPRRIRRGPNGAPDYSRHPNDGARISSGQKKGEWSTAAGRYQINKPTWDERAALHPDLTDFTPANQDKAAWYLAADTYAAKTGRDLADDLRDPSRHPTITGALRGRWPSLPGGIQQGQDQDEFTRRMDEGVSRHGPKPPPR